MSGLTHNTPAPLIVFTDLDGTLLDHETYSFSAAQQALEAVSAANIPLVLASSKTAAEMADLAQRLPCSPAALIVENGAGVVWPGESLAAQTRHAELLSALASLPPQLRAGFSGFSEWGAAGVAADTGLPLDAAAKAAKRQFSEPGRWQGDEAGQSAFIAALAAKGITARHGGRYLTLSFGADKANRMAEVAARLAPKARRIALGDAPNDAAMLEAADLGIIVANPHGTPLPPLKGEGAGHIRRTSLPGPEGWNQALCEILISQGLLPAEQT